MQFQLTSKVISETDILFECYCVCSVPRFVCFFFLYFCLVCSFSYTFISTVSLFIFFFNFMPLYIFIFWIHTYFLAPVASCFFHILLPIHPRVPVVRTGLYSPRRTHGFIGRLLCLLWARGGGVWHLTETIIPRTGFETAIVWVNSYCHTSAVCQANVHRSELQIETSLLWKWITHFPKKLPASIQIDIVLQCAV